ncbi:tRNA threonylcarbamoyladenosine dehydratase [Absicoccus porci]|jgi:tRNA A37 threonylcarbamoyladenosine dehydratase|uniref:tRNA threonylcarbamoyladenosine dehydratase n=1 Tax=Absicoccus porci TaxID=2486576 RepID=UPI003D8FBAA5
MINRYARTEMLLGKEAMEKLNQAHVAVFGIGGVGGYVVEALARSGVGHLDIIDNDTVSITNINRQIIALDDTIGQLKVDVMEKRIHAINPQIEVTKHACFFLPETSDQFDFSQYDYVVDCVDTVTAKIEIIMKAKAQNIPVISAMGAGNKMDPAKMEVADIYQTSYCPLAKVMRREMKKRHIKHLKVVYSKEKPMQPKWPCEENTTKKHVPGSMAFTPGVMGLIMASEIVKDLVNYE